MGAVQRPKLMWAARGLFVGAFLVLLGVSLVPRNDGTLAGVLFALMTVCFIVSLLCAVLARRPTGAYPARPATERKRRRLQIATVVLACLALASLGATPLAPMGVRLALAPMGLLLIVLATVLLVLSLPTREESGQTDESKPSPRGRIGLMVLVLAVLMVVLPLVQHAI